MTMSSNSVSGKNMETPKDIKYFNVEEIDKVNQSLMTNVNLNIITIKVI